VRPGLRTAGRHAVQLRAGRLGDAVLAGDRPVLSALGLGAWLSQFIHTGLARTFIEVELGVSLVGGLSAPALYLSYSRPGAFLPLLYGSVVVVGTLVGLELPLLMMRIVKEQLDFKDLVSRVLTFDYIGSLSRRCCSPSSSCRNWGWCAPRCSSA